MVASYLLYFI
jgi:hypothetical protein